MILIPLWAIHHSKRLGYTDPETFNPDRFLKHPKLANDYAGSPDYNDRDKYCSPSAQSYADIPPDYIITDTVLAGECALEFI